MAELIVLATAFSESMGDSIALELELLRGVFDHVRVVSPAPFPPVAGVEQIAAPQKGRAKFFSSPRALTWLTAAGLREVLRLRKAARLRRAIPGGAGVLLALGPDAAVAAAMLRDAGDRRAVAVRLWRTDLENLSPITQRALGLLDLLFVPATEDRDRLAKSAPELANRIEVFPAALEDTSERCASSSDGVLRILTVGEIPASTRIRLLVSALRKSADPIEWTHLGEGPGLRELSASCSSLQATVQVRFEGPLSMEKLALHFRERPVDLFFDVGEDERGRTAALRGLARGVPALSVAAAGDDLVAGSTLPSDIPTAELALRLRTFALAPAGDREARRAAARAFWEARRGAGKNLPSLAARLHDLGSGAR